MQDNKPSDHVVSGRKNIWDKIGNLIEGALESLELSRRRTQIAEESLKNTMANIELVKNQNLLKAASKDVPVFLTSEQRLTVLESLLVVRAREGQSTEDIVQAIAAVRQNIIELESIKPKPIPRTSRRDQEIVHTHKYSLPVLDEVGDIIGTIRSLLLLGTAAAALGFVMISINDPHLCDMDETSSSPSPIDEEGKIYTNNSAFCQLQENVGKVFRDYQELK